MTVTKKKPSIFRYFLELLYPDLCFACQKRPRPQDRSICLRCEYHIAPTNFHTMKDNPALQRFWGRIELEHAATSFAFSKGGLLQELIHKLKYKNQPNIGIELGKMYGHMLKGTSPYDSIDYIIPVPLHPKKKHTRGYNQAAMFAQGLGEVMDVAWSEDILQRVTYTSSQTKKSRMERFANVKDAFAVEGASKIAGKHLLVVDDVITTGATLEACATKLLAIEGTKVSLAAIALAN